MAPGSLVQTYYSPGPEVSWRSVTAPLAKGLRPCHTTRMNKKQKDLIRLFIIERLYAEDSAVLLRELCYDENIEDMFGAREFFEAQVERINKFFNYPEIQLEEVE